MSIRFVPSGRLGKQCGICEYYLYVHGIIGDVGKAICVVLLVMQVAGSGGTFPIEVAPEIFQKIYPFLPFTHSMAAMRECVAGFYQYTYWAELGIMCLFLLASLFWDWCFENR